MKKIFLIMFCMVLLVGAVSATTTYTPTTVTNCNQIGGQLICNKVLYSGITNVYEDEQWKSIEDARSLMGSGIEVVILEDDKDFPVKVIDFNYTSITVKLNPDGLSIFGEDVPIRIWEYDKEKIVDKELAEGYKDTYTNVIDEEISFWLLNQQEIVTYDFSMDSILEFGYNSTTIQLQENNTENLDDTQANSLSPATPDGADAQLEIGGSPTGESTVYIKFNISSIPAGSIIEDTLLVLYMIDSYESGEIYSILTWELDNRTWTEESLTWNTQPISNIGALINNWTGRLGTGTHLHLNFSVTSWVNESFNNGYQNVSFFFNVTPVQDFDMVRFRSKESLGDENRPYLNVTYTHIPLVINITYPVNDTNYTTIPTTLDWTVGGMLEEACWYSDNDGATNTTVTCGDLSISITPGQGSSTYFMWANDSLANEVSDNITFYVDSIHPALNIVYPVEDFIWYGWDTDGNHTILVDLNWTSDDTNPDDCWYTNAAGDNVTVTCGDNVTTLIDYGSVDWSVWGNDTLNNLGFDTQTTRYAALINNSHTANTSTYETKTETFSVNLTYPSSEFTISAKLNFSGTEYVAARTGAGDTAIFTKTFDMPTVGASSVNKTYNFNITLNNGTNLYYVTDDKNINVTPIVFQECDGTYGPPFLNYTFKDEESDLYIDASVPTSDFDFWLGTGTVKDSYHFADAVDTASYEFCFSLNETLHTDLTFQYKQDPGFSARTESFVGDLTNTTTYKILFLTGTANGQYITFQIQSSVGTGIPDATIQIERKIGGAWTTIGTDNSDDAGQVVFYLDTTLDHRLTVTHADYETEVLTIRPSQAVYTIILTLSGGEPAEYTSPYRGIAYSISPKARTWLSEDTIYAFTFNISANYSNLITYSINITDKNMNQLNSTQGTTATGSNLTVLLDTTGFSKLYGHYYVTLVNGTGVYLLDPILWPIRDIEAGSNSVIVYFQNLMATPTDIADDYTRLTLVFFLIFVGFAAFCRSTGMELAQPGITLFIVFFLTLALSILGFLSIDFAPSAFMNQYAIALIIFFITGGYTIGQWAKT